jgi:hypothetical protein
MAPVSGPVASSPAQSTPVGRGGALDVLSETWKRALRGERQIVFITGELGIGKTALAEVFRRLRTERSPIATLLQLILADGRLPNAPFWFLGREGI